MPDNISQIYVYLPCESEIRFCETKSVEQKQLSKYYSEDSFTQYEKSQLDLPNYRRISIESNKASDFTFYSQSLLIRTKPLTRSPFSSTLHTLAKNLRVSFWFNRECTHKNN